MSRRVEGQTARAGLHFGRTAPLFLLVTFACSATGPAASRSGAWVGTVTRDGDVTTVVNESGSLWGAPAQLTEEASIGVDVGSEEYMLGTVSGIAANDDRIYVADRSLSLVRVYDYDGNFVTNIGGPGDGPGEFNEPRGIAVADDGTLYVYSQGRVNVFSPDGVPADEFTFTTGGFSSGRPPVLTRDGTLYFHNRVVDPSGPRLDLPDRPDEMLAANPQVPDREHVAIPALPHTPMRLVNEMGNSRMWTNVPFAPSLVWAMAPSGAMVAGVSSNYRFEIHHPDGLVTIVEKEWQSVPVVDDERQYHRRSKTASMRRSNPEWQWNGPPVPAYKPAFSAFYPGSDGRIWILRIVDTERLSDCDPENPDPDTGRLTDCWRETLAFDIFAPDGRFLGNAPAPRTSLRFPMMRGDDVIAYVEDENFVPTVKRFRLIHPE